MHCVYFMLSFWRFTFHCSLEMNFKYWLNVHWRFITIVCYMKIGKYNNVSNTCYTNRVLYPIPIIFYFRRPHVRYVQALYYWFWFFFKIKPFDLFYWLFILFLLKSFDCFEYFSLFTFCKITIWFILKFNVLIII